MKLQILHIIIGLCCVLKAQTQVFFNNVYDWGGNQNEAFIDIFEFDDNYLISGVLDTLGFGNKQISTLSKIDQNGNVVFQKTYNIGDNSIEFNSVTLFKNSFFIHLDQH